MSGGPADPAAMWMELSRRMAQVAGGLQSVRDASVGCTPRTLVWQLDKLRLYRYLPLPLVPPATSQPVLICFALVNRPYVLDLRPDRSMVRSLLSAGLDVYVIDWGDPDEGDRLLDLEDYIERYLGGCVRFLLERGRIGALDLLGVCQGGTFALCYTALHPEQIANLVTITAPVDFQTEDDLLSRWVRHVDLEQLARVGNVPGAMLNALFLSLRPFRLLQGKYLGLLERAADVDALGDFVRMEKWVFDNPDQSASALAQFVRWFYQENRLVHGSLELGGGRVNLAHIVQPLLNIYATHDHIVPAASAAALGRYVGSSDYTAHPIDAGHVGIYVSRKSFEEVSGRLVSWLRQRR